MARLSFRLVASAFLSMLVDMFLMNDLAVGTWGNSRHTASSRLLEAILGSCIEEEAQRIALGGCACFHRLTAAAPGAGGRGNLVASRGERVGSGTARTRPGPERATRGKAEPRIVIG
ncbi:hypothetical protein GQ53DRAFT_351058 [Thozetella sp. PMI_491]|nr:hypothetical protein GQ53DRAFT_351058 [Thozetella sp. PMI_491]